MALSTFDDIVAALGSWLERDDLTARAADFITLAEAQMNRTLRLRDMEVRATSQLQTTDLFFNLPVDFREEKSVKIDDGSCSWALDPMPIQVIEASRPFTGRPTHYALVGDAIHVYPTPDKTYTATLIYYGDIPPLTAENQTNWLLARAPDAYLYGALTQAAPFLEDDTGTGDKFANLYLGAVTGLKAERRTKVGSLRSEAPHSHGRHSFNINTGGY